MVANKVHRILNEKLSTLFFRYEKKCSHQIPDVGLQLSKVGDFYYAAAASSFSQRIQTKKKFHKNIQFTRALQIVCELKKHFINPLFNVEHGSIRNRKSSIFFPLQ